MESILENVRFEIVEDLTYLARFACEWDNLAFQGSQLLPTLTYAWVSSYFENMLEPGEKWRCLLAFQDQRLIGVLPMVISRHGFLSLHQSRAKTPSNKHCFAVDFLALPEHQADITRILLGMLLREQRDLYDFSLNRLPATSPTLSILADDRIPELVTVRDFDGFGSYLPIKEGYNAFQKSLSQNFSRNLSKARKKMAGLTGSRTIFLTGSDANVESFQEFLKVEASGWKAKAGTAILMSPKLTTFYNQLVGKLSSTGKFELHFIKVNDNFIAAQMAAKIGRTLVLLKIGYDENYSYCSPGNILFEKTVERAYASGDTDEINCITDMAWHDNWKMLKRPYFNLWIYPRRPIPYVVGALGRRAKNTIRQLPLIPGFYRRLRDRIQKEPAKN